MQMKKQRGKCSQICFLLCCLDILGFWNGEKYLYAKNRVYSHILGNFSSVLLVPKVRFTQNTLFVFLLVTFIFMKQFGSDWACV